LSQASHIHNQCSSGENSPLSNEATLHLHDCSYTDVSGEIIRLSDCSLNSA